MLGDHDAIATVAVKDLARAKEFYEGKLGLKLTPQQEPGSLSYQGGKFALFVYESRYAGTNQATAVTWDCGKDVESIVQELKSKGATFEHYPDLPDTKIVGDLHLAGPMKLAWLKDPDGNIHALAGT
ncbi:MAG TPA: VOC family protein [Thermoanaerobaculia bacterium]|nr:VOC family protein [Thermoanaerobaculia bacterium]